jgi:hypothetical protein
MKLKMIIFVVILAILLMVSAYAIAIGLTGGVYIIRECKGVSSSS